MCTALSLLSKDKHYFGRNNDLEYQWGQEIVITPRNYVWDYKYQPSAKCQHAIIGMAYNLPLGNKKYPLYAECANEKGLAAAGLNFPSNAFYPEHGAIKGAFELAPYELIPYVLSNFSTVKEVQAWLAKVNLQLVNTPIIPQIPPAPLHVIFYDKNDDCITLEPTKDGLKIYDNELGILTNNPPFDWQLQNLAFYQNLGVEQKTESTWVKYKSMPFGQGFASVGMPGDWTPPSRFVRTAFLKAVSDGIKENEAALTQFFHILDNVAMVKGSIRFPSHQPGVVSEDITLYTSCIDLEESIFYYKTYFNNQIEAVCLMNENLDSLEPIAYPFAQKQSIKFLNKK